MRYPPAPEVRFDVRVRAWLLACTALLIVLVPIVIAGTALATVDRGLTTVAADAPYGAVASAPLQATSVTRQAVYKKHAKRLIAAGVSLRRRAG